METTRRKERKREKKKGGEGQVSRFIIPLKGLTTLTTRTSLLPFLLYILRFRIVIPARGGSRESSNSRARHQRSSASYCSLEERLLRLRRFPPLLLCTEGVPPIAGTIENEAENKPRDRNGIFVCSLEILEKRRMLKVWEFVARSMGSDWLQSGHPVHVSRAVPSTERRFQSLLIDVISQSGRKFLHG